MLRWAEHQLRVLLWLGRNLEGGHFRDAVVGVNDLDNVHCGLIGVLTEARRYGYTEVSKRLEVLPPAGVSGNSKLPP